MAAILRSDHPTFGLRLVENALGMIARAEGDHRFYEYPAASDLDSAHSPSPTRARRAKAYLAARSLIALGAGVDRPLAAVSSRVSRGSALVVALVPALSPIDIETAHMWHPSSVIAALLFADVAPARLR